ncbi:MAG: hypothetical protein AB7V16_06995 [Vulcanibacillus sp.]
MKLIRESFMSDLHYMKKEDEKLLKPFIGYAKNQGLDNEDQAAAIFYRVRGSVAKKQGDEVDELTGEDMGILWGEYKDAIKDALSSKKEGCTPKNKYRESKLNEDNLELDDVTLFGMLTALMTKIDDEGSKEFKVLTRNIDKIMITVEKYFDSKYPNWDEVYEDLLQDASDHIYKY